MKRENRIYLVLLVLFLICGFLLWVTVPDQCKTPIEQMDSFCKGLLYP